MAGAESAARDRLRASLLTAKAPGAIAIIALEGTSTELDEALRSLCGESADALAGSVALRSFADIDEGLLVRLRKDLAWLMPHGGVRIVERLAEALEALGVAWMPSFDEARNGFPEAADEIEARMLSVLATAASPLAIPLLLDQPRRWREHEALGDRAPGFTEGDRVRWRRLDRLLDPPRVCVVGPPNAGKSTLANTLAGREIAIASPVAGTTRDFVSARIDLAGLVVEWLDLPGFPEAEIANGMNGTNARDSVDAAAIALASQTLAHADLVVLLAAPAQAWSGWPRSEAHSVPVLRVMSKADLPEAEASLRSREADLRISAATGEGIAEFVTRVQGLLVPTRDLDNPRPWRWRDHSR